MSTFDVIVKGSVEVYVKKNGSVAYMELTYIILCLVATSKSI
jgi:hypothetical protein